MVCVHAFCFFLVCLLGCLFLFVRCCLLLCSMYFAFCIYVSCFLSVVAPLFLFCLLLSSSYCLCFFTCCSILCLLPRAFMFACFCLSLWCCFYLLVAWFYALCVLIHVCIWPFALELCLCCSVVHAVCVLLFFPTLRGSCFLLLAARQPPVRPPARVRSRLKVAQTSQISWESNSERSKTSQRPSEFNNSIPSWEIPNPRNLANVVFL